MRGEELALIALLKEHKRLVGIADRARIKFDTVNDAGTQLIKVQREMFMEMKKPYSKTQLANYERLGAEVARLEKLRKLDIIKLIDKQLDAESNARALGTYIGRIQFRIDIQKEHRTPARR